MSHWADRPGPHVRGAGGVVVREAEGAEFQCYVAMGDSLTAGIAGTDTEVLWARELCSALRLCTPALSFRNVAEYGAQSDGVLAEQLPAALSRHPDLVTVICGANDVLLHTRPSVDRFAEHFDRLLATLLACVDGLVVTATYGDFTAHLPFRERSKARVAGGMSELNEAIRSIAAARGALLVDLAREEGSELGENYRSDGIHPTSLGHRRIAASFRRSLKSQWVGRQHTHQ